MRNAMLAVVALGMLGCGGAANEAPPSVPRGKWISNISPTCARGLSFSDGSRFSYRIACVGGDGTIEVEHEDGTFTLTRDTITFSPTEASCPAASLAGAAKIAFDATTLSLSDASATIVFEPNASAGSGAGTFGCFGMGSFTPAPIRSLP